MALKNDLYINVEPYTEVLGGAEFCPFHQQRCGEIAGPDRGRQDSAVY